MNRQALAIGLFLCGFVLWFTHATAASDVTEIIASPDAPKGGVIVHLGSADAGAMIKHRDAGRFLVQSVLFDQAAVDAARKAIVAKKAYGPVSVIEGSSKRLPYTDNFVNIVVIDDPAAFKKSRVPVAEVARVVVPNGLILVAGDDAVAKSIATACKAKTTTKVGTWTKVIKPRPAGMDEWTHVRHDPEGSRVSNDTLNGKTIEGKVWLFQAVNKL